MTACLLPLFRKRAIVFTHTDEYYARLEEDLEALHDPFGRRREDLIMAEHEALMRSHPLLRVAACCLGQHTVSHMMRIRHEAEHKGERVARARSNSLQALQAIGGLRQSFEGGRPPTGWRDWTYEQEREGRSLQDLLQAEAGEPVVDPLAKRLALMAKSSGSSSSTVEAVPTSAAGMASSLSKDMVVPFASATATTPVALSVPVAASGDSASAAPAELHSPQREKLTDRLSRRMSNMMMSTMKRTTVGGASARTEQVACEGGGGSTMTTVAEATNPAEVVPLEAAASASAPPGAAPPTAPEGVPPPAPEGVPPPDGTDAAASPSAALPASEGNAEAAAVPAETEAPLAQLQA